MLHLFGHDDRGDRRDYDLIEHPPNVDNARDRLIDTFDNIGRYGEPATPLHDDGTSEDNPCRGVELHGVAGGAAVD